MLLSDGYGRCRTSWSLRTEDKGMCISYNIYVQIPKQGPSWSWSYGCWIYNYLCTLWNEGLSPLKLWARISLMARCTQYNSMWSSLSVTCGRSMVFSGYSVSFVFRARARDSIIDGTISFFYIDTCQFMLQVIYTTPSSLNC